MLLYDGHFSQGVNTTVDNRKWQLSFFFVFLFFTAQRVSKAVGQTIEDHR